MMPTVEKKNHRLTMRWDDFYKQCAIRVQSSEDKESVCKEISNELLLKCASLKENSTKYHFKLTRRHVRNIGMTILPKCPQDLYKRVSAIESTRVAARMEKPIIMMADKLIGLIVVGLKDGIERKQYPQVIFCLNYLIALRPNDLNRGHIRVGVCRNGVIPGDHIMCQEHLFNKQKIVGTLLNKNPSKFKAKHEILSYSTVYICDPADYELLERGIAFVQNQENATIPCTGRVSQYLANQPSGATTSQEWGNCRKGVMKAMIERLQLNTCVVQWASHKFGFTKQLGRGFVASCVEQGRFKLEQGLAPLKSVELLLGHEKLSSSNVCYLKMDARATQIPGVTLRRVSTENPVGCVQYGVCLTKDVDNNNIA
jgi:hypothetical protein